MYFRGLFLAGLAIFALGFVATTPRTAKAAEDSILVLDGSGSMWGQIDGKAKIEIARDVIGNLLDDIPAERRLGLVAYGHNRKGDCSDIEVLANVGAGRDEIRDAVNSISPKGKTPLSDAVKFAAEQLKYTEEKATVILVSDGIETCDLDPCAVGAELEAAGVDFTAHVVGFDVGEIEAAGQLQCLAENTGGQYLPASNGDELLDALQETVASEPEPPSATEAIETTMFTLRATELAGGPLVETGLFWKVQQAGGGNVVFEASDAGVVSAVVPPGVYDIFVERPSDGQKGSSTNVQIRPGTEKLVTVALDLNLSASVRTVPEGEAPVVSEIVVYWEGPNREGDYVTVVDHGASPGAYKDYEYTRDGNPLKLTIPATTGDYEVRYVLGRPNRVLASVPITATEVEASLTAVASIAAGKSFDVSWTGPGYDSDWITIVEPDAGEKNYGDYAYTRSGNPVTLKAPLEAGSYELRYVMAGQKIIARAPIEVTAVAGTLDAPDEAEVGSYVQVKWTGPGGDRDWITVVKPDAADNSYTDYAYIRDGSSLELRMPLYPGDYEVRYVQDGKKVLVRRPVVITDTSVSFDAPGDADVGAPVSIEFDGPNNKRDWITVTKPDAAENAYTDYKYADKGSPVELDMPLNPGEYELRYVLAGKRVVGRQPIIINEIEVTITAPPSAKAGTEVEINFTGPGYYRDYISVVAPDAADRAYINYKYTRNGSPVSLAMPDKPGTYEIRYVLGSKRAITRQTIEVTE